MNSAPLTAKPKEGTWPNSLALDRASSHRIEERGGIEKLDDGSLVQAVAAQKVAIERCIEILTAAKSDDECEEAARLVADILETVLQGCPLQ